MAHFNLFFINEKNFLNVRFIGRHMLFGKELFILFAVSAFRKLSSFYVFSYFPFGFEGRIWDLIVSVPDHCLSFYFTCYFVRLWLKTHGLGWSGKISCIPSSTSRANQGWWKHDRFEHASTVSRFFFFFFFFFVNAKKSINKKVIKRSFYRHTHFIWCVYG